MFFARIHRLSLIAVIALPIVLSACSTPRPEQAYTLEQNQVYIARDGQPLYADVYTPSGSGPFPGVLVIHGGGWRRGDKSQMNDIAEALARNGFVAVNIGYRLAPTYQFPAPVHDVKEAVRWMRRNAEQINIDPGRIGVFGYSAGAHLAMMLALTRPADGLEGATQGAPVDTRVQAVVAGGTPADMLAFSENDTLVAFLGGTKSELPEIYRQASPVSYVRSGAPPTFLYHGRFDWIVDVEQSRRLTGDLREAGVEVQYKESTLGHVATFLLDDEEVEQAIAFLRRWLRSG